MKLITVGDISVFENKTSFQAKTVAAATAAATKINQKSLKISSKMKEKNRFFFSRKLLILHALEYQGRKFQAT